MAGDEYSQYYSLPVVQCLMALCLDVPMGDVPGCQALHL